MRWGIGTSSLSILSILMSWHSPVLAKRSDAVYVGAGAGWSWIKPRGKGYEDIPDPSSVKINKTASHFSGMGLAGYEYVCPASDWIMAGEAFFVYNGSTSKKTHEFTDTDIRYNSVQNTWCGGVSFNSGVDLHQGWTAWARLGAVYGKFQMKQTVKDGAVTGYNGGKETKGVWGIMPGVRLGKSFNNQWSIMLDGTYTFYQSMKSKDFSPAGDHYYISIRPQVANILLSVQYKFKA